MLKLGYKCLSCHKDAPEGHQTMICPYCEGDLRGEGFPMVTGTRDGFGIGQNFIDERTHKEITTWREWEKAGYREPKLKNPKANEAFKEKRKQIGNQRQRQPLPSELPV
jgi:hypothetical protein